MKVHIIGIGTLNGSEKQIVPDAPQIKNITLMSSEETILWYQNNAPEDLLEEVGDNLEEMLNANNFTDEQLDAIITITESQKEK